IKEEKKNMHIVDTTLYTLPHLDLYTIASIDLYTIPNIDLYVLTTMASFNIISFFAYIFSVFFVLFLFLSVNLSAMAGLLNPLMEKNKQELDADNIRKEKKDRDDGKELIRRLEAQLEYSKANNHR